jgi:hypothetical protein
MGTFGPIHWIILLVELTLFVISIIAATRILRRMGFSPWWVLVGILPIVNVIGLWRLSKARWPNAPMGPAG